MVAMALRDPLSQDLLYILPTVDLFILPKFILKGNDHEWKRQDHSPGIESCHMSCLSHCGAQVPTESTVSFACCCLSHPAPDPIA